MGEIHKASLEGLKLCPKHGPHAPIIAFFMGFWYVLFVAFDMGSKKANEEQKSAIIKAAVCMWLTTPVCFAGWIWAIKWAMAAKAQSA